MVDPQLRAVWLSHIAEAMQLLNRDRAQSAPDVVAALVTFPAAAMIAVLVLAARCLRMTARLRVPGRRPAVLLVACVLTVSVAKMSMYAAVARHAARRRAGACASSAGCCPPESSARAFAAHAAHADGALGLSRSRPCTRRPATADRRDATAASPPAASTLRELRAACTTCRRDVIATDIDYGSLQLALAIRN